MTQLLRLVEQEDIDQCMLHYSFVFVIIFQVILRNNKLKYIMYTVNIYFDNFGDDLLKSAWNYVKTDIFRGENNYATYQLLQRPQEHDIDDDDNEPKKRVRFDDDNDHQSRDSWDDADEGPWTDGDDQDGDDEGNI